MQFCVLAASCGMRNFPTRAQTCAPTVEVWSLNHWVTRESDERSFGHAEMQILRNKQEMSGRQLDMVGMELGKAWEPLERQHLNTGRAYILGAEAGYEKAQGGKGVCEDQEWPLAAPREARSVLDVDPPPF